jgi:hypothetical protein
MTTIRLMLIGLSLMALAGCEHWADYRGIPAGADAFLWRPQGVSNADFDAQTAFPADLAMGRGTRARDAQNAVNAVDRVRHERPVTLPASAISQIGQGGAAAVTQP